MTMLGLAAVTTLMLSAVVACGKKGDAADKPGETSTTSAAVSAKASCDMVAELGTCNEYRGADGAGLGAGRTSFGLEKSLCEGFHGKFANAGCSTDGQVGSCLMSDGEVKRYYGSTIAGDHALSVEEAKGDCESELLKGKFTVDPNASAASVAAPEPPKSAPKAAKPAAKAALAKALAANK